MAVTAAVIAGAAGAGLTALGDALVMPGVNDYRPMAGSW